jgi:hypothetical protein
VQSPDINSYLVFLLAAASPVAGKRYRLSLIVALLLPNGACVYVQSRAGVVGTYQLDSDHQRIVLELSPDGNFTETISYRKGEVTKHVGRCDFKPANYDLTFDSLWIPLDVAQDSVPEPDWMTALSRNCAAWAPHAVRLLQREAELRGERSVAGLILKILGSLPASSPSIFGPRGQKP